MSCSFTKCWSFLSRMISGVVSLRVKTAMEEGDNADEGGGGRVLRITAAGKDF